MDYLLFAALNLELIWVITQVAIALGLVIFVHELGHFAVAKWCGVKCEKFYLGFDIFGLKLAKFKKGETEYGIGILPLGGYVKMLGQDDNPAAMAEEIERAKLKKKESGEEVPEDTTELFDPRSYLAQSVPERMAIISAGVIMNVIFAVVFGTIAYGLGVNYTPCTLSLVQPGSPAWKKGLHIGDTIIEINGVENPSFRELRTQTALAWHDHVNVKVKRGATGEIDELTIPLDRDSVSRKLVRTIGVMPARTTAISEAYDPDSASFQYSSAGRAEPALQGGDQVLSINGVEIEDYADVMEVLARYVDDDLIMKVRRETEDSDQPKEVEIRLPRDPLKRLGLRMEWGEITAIQAGSSAEEAGLQTGDVILSVDGRKADQIDAVALPQELRRRAFDDPGSEVEIVVKRGGERRTISVPLRAPDTYEVPRDEGQSMPVSALGLAYHVGNRVIGVVDGLPAAESDDLVGRVVKKIRIVPAEGEKDKEEQGGGPLEIDFSAEKPNWPSFITRLQYTRPNSEIEFQFTEGEPAKVQLKPVETELSFPIRGLMFAEQQEIRQAGSVGEAFGMGFRETINSVLQVYVFLQKLFTGAVSPRALGGPVTIAKVAGYSAYEGLAKLLIFMTLLSANLAVLNFLPIPLLDGGHMVFLIYEAIARKPASAKVQQAFNLVGLCLLLTLMGWVLLLDLDIIPRVQ